MRAAHGEEDNAAAPVDRRRWWRVDCKDAANSRLFLDVLVDRDRVVLVGPPGHTAALRANGLGQLTYALRDAAVQARK